MGAGQFVLRDAFILEADLILVGLRMAMSLPSGTWSAGGARPVLLNRSDNCLILTVFVTTVNALLDAAGQLRALLGGLRLIPV